MALARFETEFGDFDIELALERAPITATYFRDLISGGALSGSTIFRIVSAANGSLRADHPIEVVQGGLKDTDAQPIAPIAHEPTSDTGLLHKQWAVSTARFDPGQTYGSFFICMRDEPSLDFGGGRHPDGLGFAVFGSVVKGFDVVEALFSRAEPEEFLKNQIPIKSCYLVSAS